MAIHNDSIVSTIVDEIRHRIWDNQYAPGDRLREVELSKQFGVSRTPVREALRNLEACGLVRIISHKGAVVHTQLTEKERA